MANTNCLICHDPVDGTYVCEKEECATDFTSRRCKVCDANIVAVIEDKYPQSEHYNVILKLFPRSVCPIHA